MARQRKPSKVAVAAAWRGFWDTPEGRAAIGALMATFGVYNRIEVGDAVAAGVAIGERNVAVWIAEQVGARPEDFVQERSELDRMLERLGMEI